MRIVVGLLGVAIACTACSTDPPQRTELAKPEIPEALHGCWELREPPSEEYPDGLSSTLTVDSDGIVIEAKGIGRRIGTIEKVERVTPRLIEGLISAKESDRLVTLATTLELDPDGAPPGTLLLREGDAGSYHYRRCRAPAASPL